MANDPRMHTLDSEQNRSPERSSWGKYINPKLKRNHMENAPTRNEVEKATLLYLNAGGTIQRLDNINNPGELAQTSGFYEFTKTSINDFTNIF